MTRRRTAMLQPTAKPLPIATNVAYTLRSKAMLRLTLSATLDVPLATRTAVPQYPLLRH